MSLKCARSTGPPVLALVVLALSGCVAWSRGPVVAGAAPPASPGAAQPALALLSQSTSVTPGQGWHVQLAVGPVGALPGLRLVMTVYAEVRDRSTFDQTLSATDDHVLDEPQVLPVSTSRPTFTVPVVTSGGSSTTPTIDLGCPSTPGECEGVYPISLALERKGSGTVVGRLTTYLTYVVGATDSKLRVSLEVPFGAPVTVRRTADPAAALPAPTPASVSRLAALAGALAHGGAPVTVAVDPRTVQSLRAAGTPADLNVLNGLSQLSSEAAAVPAGSEWPAQPYVPVDVGALAGAGLTGEIQLQMARGAEVLRGTVRTATSPLTWIADGPVGSDLVSGLANARASRVVIPDTALASDPVRLGITQTFGLALGHGPPVPAAASDSELAARFDADPSDPALAATQMLAELALIHFEEPNASEPRGVVTVAPANWTGDPRFVATLLGGLATDPVVSAVTLSQFFDQVPAGGSEPDTQPSVRHLSAGSGTGPAVPRAVARQIAGARLRQASFQSAVLGQPRILSQLGDVLLASESDQLVGTTMRQGLGTYERSLDAQLSQVQLANDRTITLTARTASVPVTILSSAGYTMVGDLSLASDKFEFPQGATRQRFVISRNTNSVRIEVRARTSGDLPLEVTLTAPRVTPGTPPLVITHGQLTVRSTATSAVGVGLTLAAAAVLLGWWIRTWRRGRSARTSHRQARSGGPDAPSPGAGDDTDGAGADGPRAEGAQAPA